jgi:MFS family permease
MSISPAGRRSRILFAALGLALATAVTAIVLVPFNLEFGSDLWTDPQDDTQVLGQWRSMAAFAYTSGGWIGQVFALLSGVLVARWSAKKARRVGLAVAAGLGLGLTDLVAAWSRAAPELHRATDPVLIHHGCVIEAMQVALLLFAISSVLGFEIGRAQGVAKRLAWTTASAVFVLLCVPVIRYGANDLFVQWATPIR